MLCDQCRERDAIVHLTQIVESSVSQVHLCEKCAAERGIEAPSVAPKSALGDFLQAVQEQAAQLPGDSPECKQCGLTLADFRSTGRLGCSHCYGAFGHSLRELLRRVHGGTSHVGWRYAGGDPEVTKRDARLTELRRELQRAIEREEFESAAAIRDEIRGIE